MGKRVLTTHSESIDVKLREIDEVEKVLLLENIGIESSARSAAKKASSE